MTVPEPDDLDGSLEMALLENGPVVLSWRTSVLASTCAALGGLGYHVVRLDAGHWRGQADALHALAAALEFPDYFGGNLDALGDCLADVAERSYGIAPGKDGLVLVIERYDTFREAAPRAASAVLDIFARQAWHGLLHGTRMLCLVQVDDRATTMDAVGARSVTWNPAEWFDSARGL